MASFLQSKSANGNSTAPSAVFTTAPKAGNLLVCGVYSAKATAITMSSAGWTPGTSTTAGSGGTTRAIRMFYKLALDGESSTVTAVSATGGWVIAIAEYPGINKLALLNVENVQTNASAVAQPTPTLTPTYGDSLLIVCLSACQTASSSFSNETVNAATTGVTEREDNASSANGTATLYDKFVSDGSGTYVGSADVAGSGVGAGAMMIFNVLRYQMNDYQFPKTSGLSVGEVIK